MPRHAHDQSETPLGVHRANVSVTVDAERLATVTLRCVDCGGVTTFQIPAGHLVLLANACAAAAQRLGLTAVTVEVATREAPGQTEAPVEACFAALSKKVH